PAQWARPLLAGAPSSRPAAGSARQLNTETNSAKSEDDLMKMPAVTWMCSGQQEATGNVEWASGARDRRVLPS
ncbi:MAG: hypothetical protein MUF25_28710, partial [Pirellulaceae bacterium]|nr:hypothetical protein [Pirellulaceae bacterium]